jgi:hypothetical protein
LNATSTLVAASAAKFLSNSSELNSVLIESYDAGVFLFPNGKTGFTNLSIAIVKREPAIALPTNMISSFNRCQYIHATNI